MQQDLQHKEFESFRMDSNAKCSDLEQRLIAMANENENLNNSIMKSQQINSQQRERISEIESALN